MSSQQHCIEIRFATPADAQRVLEIYTPYIKETPITFETEVPPLALFSERMAKAANTYPYLIAEQGGHIVGYAYAHPCGEKAAYEWNAELTVYLDRTFRGKGCGRMLCETLLDLLAAQGIRNVFSLITIPNDASFRLHEALGFEHMGTQGHAGYKCNAWHDVAWLQKSLGDFSCAPAPLTPITELHDSIVETVFAQARERAAKRSR